MDPKIRQARLKALLQLPHAMDLKSGNRILPRWPQPAAHVADAAIPDAEPIASSASDRNVELSKLEAPPSQENQFPAEASFFEDFPATQPDRLEVQPSQESQFAAETGFSCLDDFPATQPTVEDLLNTQLIGFAAETQGAETKMEETQEVIEKEALTAEGKKRTSSEVWPAGFFSEASIAQRKKNREMLSAA